MENKEELVEDESLVNKLQEKLFIYAIEHERKPLNKEELKDFCNLLVKYCKLTRHTEAKLPIPEIKFVNASDYNTHGGYINRNIIEINESFLNDFLNKTRKLSDLINTIGHEMMHYHQNSAMIEYDNLSVEQQQKTDNKTKSSIDSYKNYFKLDKGDVEILHNLLAPYLNEGEIPDGYEKIENFYSDVSYASYYTIQSEKEARTEGANFALDFYKKLSKSKHKFFVLMREKYYFKNMQKFYDNYYDKTKKQFDDFSKAYNLNEEKILEIVEKVESENGSLTSLNGNNYLVVLKFLIKNKTTEQKESLLKNAIFNGYNRLANVIVESLQKDVDFKANKNHLSTFVSSCLTGEAYGNSKFEMPHSSYVTDYSKILNQDDFEDVVKKTMKNNSYISKIIISSSEGIKTFSLKSLLKCQEIVFSDKSNVYELYKGEKFFEALFSQVTIEQKIEYLKCGQLRSEVSETLIKCIKNDLRYKLFKDEIDKILSDKKNVNSSSKNNEVYNNEEASADPQPVVKAKPIIDAKQGVKTEMVVNEQSRKDVNANETLRQNEISTEQETSQEREF